MKSTIFWVVKPCSSERATHLRGTHHLHLQNYRVTQAWNQVYKACYLLAHGLCYDPEHGCHMILWNGGLSLNYAARPIFHGHHCEDLKSSNILKVLVILPKCNRNYLPPMFRDGRPLITSCREGTGQCWWRDSVRLTEGSVRILLLLRLNWYCAEPRLGVLCCGTIPCSPALLPPVMECWSGLLLSCCCWPSAPCTAEKLFIIIIFRLHSPFAGLTKQ
jgi:hypothetical protein